MWLEEQDIQDKSTHLQTLPERDELVVGVREVLLDGQSMAGGAEL